MGSTDNIFMQKAPELPFLMNSSTGNDTSVTEPIVVPVTILQHPLIDSGTGNDTSVPDNR